MRFRPLPFGLLAATLLIACDESAREPLAPEDPAFQPAIIDAAHSGVPGFYFLPPLVSAALYDGTFDASLLSAIRVDVCRETEGACEVVASFDAEGLGPERVRMDEEDGHYLVSWSTRGQPLGRYTATVRVLDVPLGSVDLVLVRSGRELRGVDPADVGVVGRTTVPLKFRIEQGAVALVGPEGGTVEGLGGQVTLDVPEGALPEPLAIAIRPTDPEDPEALLAFELMPWDAGFLEPVTLTVHNDPLPIPDDLDDTEEYVLEHDDAEGAWHEVPSVYDFETGGVSLELTTFALDPVEQPAPPDLADDVPSPAASIPGAAGSFTLEGVAAGATVAFTLPRPRIPRFVLPRFRIPRPRPTRARLCVLTLRVNPSSVNVLVGASAAVRLEAGRFSRGGYLGLPALSWYPVRVNSATWEDASALIDVAPGTVTGVAPGTASYRVTYPASAVYCTASSTFGYVAVSGPRTASVTLAPTEATLQVGETLQLSTTLTSALGTDVTGARPVGFTSSDEAVASVDASGLVTAVSAGNATITATSDGVSASATVVVQGSGGTEPPPPPPSSSTFSDGDFNPGDWSYTLVTHANGGTVTVTSPTSGGSPGAHMRIAQHFAAGSAPPNDSHILTFHARAGAVHDPATGGAIQSLDYSESSILFGCEFTGCGGQSTGPAIMQDGHIYVFRTGSTPYSQFLDTWRVQSSNGLTAAHFYMVMDATQPGVLHVDPARHPDFTAGASPLQFGFHRWGSHTNILTPTRTAGIDNWAITLHAAAPPPPPPPPAAVASVTVAPATATLQQGQTQAFTFHAYDADGNELTGRTATWSSDDEAAATVGADGVATAVAPGDATITATVEGVSGSAVLSVAVPVGGVVVANGGRELDVAVGADGTVYFMQCNGPDVTTFRSTDGGVTWARRGALTDGCANHPMLRVDDGGTLYFMGNGSSFLRRSTDGGQTWGPQETTPRTGMGLTGLWVTPGGDAYVIGTDYSTFPNTRIYAFRSSAGGPFTELAVLPSLGQAEFATIAVNSATGTIHVAWRQGSCGSCRVQHSRSTNGGTSWSSPSTVSGFYAEVPSITAGPLGDVLIAWRQGSGSGGEPTHSAAASSSDGSTFGPQFILEYGYPTFGRGVASAGRTFWALTRYLPFLPNADVWLSTSKTGAGGFTASQRVTFTNGELEGPFDVAGNATRVCIAYKELYSGNMKVLCRAP